MGNQEQVDRLQQGVNDWNRWRETHFTDAIDFSNADLSGADLSYAILYCAYLIETLQLHFVGGSVLSSQFGVCFRS